MDFQLESSPRILLDTFQRINHHLPSKTKLARLLHSQGIQAYRPAQHHGENHGISHDHSTQLGGGRVRAAIQKAFRGQTGNCPRARPALHSGENSYIWADKRVAILLFLDVIGAFANVSHPRLLYNLKKRRIGGQYAASVISFLAERYTIFKLMDHITERIQRIIRVFRGSPMSFIL